MTQLALYALLAWLAVMLSSASLLTWLSTRSLSCCNCGRVPSEDRVLVAGLCTGLDGCLETGRATLMWQQDSP